MCELTRRERKKEATRINIMETAIRLFNEQGFEQTTMNQVSEEADVALGTLYNHFPSKESIIGFYVHWLVEQYRQETWDQLTELPDTYSRLKLGLKLVADWHEENRKLSEIYLTDMRNFCFGYDCEPITKNPLEEIFIELFEMGKELGDIRKEMNSEVLTRHLMGTLYSATLHWFAKPQESLAEQYYLSLDIIFEGCRTGSACREKEPGSFDILYNLFF